MRACSRLVSSLQTLNCDTTDINTPQKERIANDVLSLSRIQLQVLTIQTVDFDVIDEVQQLAGVFKNELKMCAIDNPALSETLTPTTQEKYQSRAAVQLNFHSDRKPDLFR